MSLKSSADAEKELVVNISPDENVVVTVSPETNETKTLPSSPQKTSEELGFWRCLDLNLAKDPERAKGIIAMLVNVLCAVLIIPFNKWLFQKLAFR